MTMTSTRTSTGETLPVVGRPSTTAWAMRAAAAVIESTGIAGLSVTCDDNQIAIQVGSHLGDDAGRAALVARLAAALGTTAVRADSLTGPTAWVRADGALAGLPAKVFTTVSIQEAGGLPLACDNAGNIAQAATPALPAGWHWLTGLDPTTEPAAGPAAPGQVA
jgi:hypothetical protein